MAQRFDARVSYLHRIVNLRYRHPFDQPPRGRFRRAEQ
jgi:hypothetical protein